MTKIWSRRLVPRNQTCFEFRGTSPRDLCPQIMLVPTCELFLGQVPGTCALKLCWSLRVNCSWDKSPGLAPSNYAGPYVWTVLGTSPRDLRPQIMLVPTCELFLGQVPGTCALKLCWSLRVNCSWDKSPGLAPSNYAGPCVWTVLGTSPRDLRPQIMLVPACELFLGQVPGTCALKLCWSLRVNCSWDKSPGLAPSNYAGPCVWAVLGTSPRNQIKINQWLISILGPITAYGLRFKVEPDDEVKYCFY